jgi:pimeloyl-ACP methyl ester carboxylesterase
MAEQDPDLVRGVAVMGTAADRPEGPGPVPDRLGYTPVAGPALWRAVPPAYVRSELRSAFADGVPVPDEFVDDTRSLTWRAYDRSARAGRDFREDEAPYARMAATGVPLLAVVGTEDERAKAATTREWAWVPRGEVVRMRGVGHTPPWERPGPTAALLNRFAAPLLRRP